jgi:hypothetical protein
VPTLSLEFTDARGSDDGETATAAVRPVVLSPGDGLWFPLSDVMTTPEAQSRQPLQMGFASYYRIGNWLLRQYRLTAANLSATPLPLGSAIEFARVAEQAHPATWKIDETAAESCFFGVGKPAAERL